MVAEAAPDVAKKEEGNGYFKQQEFTKAIQCYSEALELNTRSDGIAPHDAVRQAVYYSNRSTCWFELGKYKLAIGDANKSLALLSDVDQGSDDQAKALILKNLLRLNRAEFYSGKDPAADAIAGPLEQLLSCHDKAYAKRAQKLSDQLRYYTKLPSAALKGRSQASLHRSALSDPAKEYYTFGHDWAVSSLRPTFDESGNVTMKGIQLQDLPPQDKKQFALLFGGVGDGRHVFATIMDMHRQLKSLSRTDQEAYRLHLTLNDINATTLAKDLLKLVAISKLAIFPSFSCVSTNAEAGQWATLLHYLPLGYVMPPDVYAKLQELLRELLAFNFKAFSNAYPCINIDPSDWDNLRTIFRYWAGEKDNDVFLDLPSAHEAIYRYFRPKDGSDPFGDAFGLHPTDSSTRTNIQKRMKEQVKEQVEEKREGMRARMADYDSWGDELKATIHKMVGPNASPSELVKAALYLVEDIDDKTLLSEPCFGVTEDDSFLQETRAILPPHRNGTTTDPVFAEARLTAPHMGENQSPSFRRAVRDAKDVIESSWKVNPTFFDPHWMASSNGMLCEDDFNPVRDFMKDYFNDECIGYMTEPPEELSSEKVTELFDFTSRFYWNVAHAIDQLGPILHLEFNLGSVINFCSSIQTSPGERSSINWPIKYHRILASNIPDYTGFLPFFTEVIPILHKPSDHVDTFLLTNVLLNTSLWNDVSHYIYSSTAIPLLELVTDLLGFQYYGCNECWGEQYWTWSKSKTGATREQLTVWLHRLYLSIVLPAERDPGAPIREECPYNISMFLRACSFCVEALQYPAHWVASVLDELLSSSGRFKTSAQLSKVSPNVFGPECKVHVLNLSAFRLELETQVALWMKQRIGRLLPLVTTRLPSEPVYRYVLKHSFIEKVFTERFMSMTQGNPHFRSLGFVLEPQKPPADVCGDALEPMMRMLDTMIGSSSPPSAPIRDDVLSQGAEKFHVVSCVEWNCNYLEDPSQQTLCFWMSEQNFQTYGSYYLSMIRTDGWYRVGTEAIQLLQADQVVQ